MDSSRPRNSTRPAKGRRFVKSPSKRRRKQATPNPTRLRPAATVEAVRKMRDGDSGRLPAAVEIAIHEERGSLIVAISILYGLHSILRRQLEGDDSEVSDAIEHAAGWADSTKLSEILLVKLHEVIQNLDNIASGITNVDPEELAIAEEARAQSQSQGGAL